VPVPAGWLAVTDSGRLAVSTGSRNHTTSWTPADIWHESRNGSGRIFVLNTKGVPEIRIDVDKPYMSGRLVPHRDLLALFDGSALTLYDLRTGKAEHSFRMGPPVEITSPADPEPRLPGRGGLSRGRVVSAHRIQALAFLPDRKALASVDDTGTLRLWDVAGSKEVDRKTLADSYPIGLSPSGDVAQPEDPGTMLLSDFIGEAVPNHLKGLAGRPVSLAFSPGGDWLAAGTGDGSIGVWRTRSPDAQFLFTGHKGAVLSLAFSRDAAVLASGGEDETVRLWNLESGQPIRTLKGHSRRVSAVAFGPDGNALASGGEDASVILWDTSKGRVAKRFRDPEGPVLSLCFSPDGSELIGGGNRSLNRWDVKERKLKGVLISGHSYEWAGRRYGPNSGFLESILVMTYSPSGEVLACGCTNNTLLVWDTKTWAGKILRPSAR
jgi:WD40 repeat protein